MDRANYIIWKFLFAALFFIVILVLQERKVFKSKHFGQWYNNEIFYVAMMVVGILFSLQNERLAYMVKGKVGVYLLRLSWPVYLNHNMFREIIPEYIGFSLKSYVIYLILVVL